MWWSGFWPFVLLLAAEPAPPAAQCLAQCREMPCQVFDFQGFAPDSRHFGYSHLTCPGAHAAAAKERQTWHLRRTRAGKGKLGTKALTVENVRYPDYFEKHDYRLLELSGERVGKKRWEFVGPSGETIVAALKTEKQVAWYLTVTRGTREVVSYRGDFEEIYFDFKPRLFVSPDGERLAVVLILDAMIKVDSALILFSLNG